MNIRESTESDRGSIRAVHQDAFGPSEGETVSQLAVDLLEDETAHPVLSLVAEEENGIIGNVIFSSVRIEDAENVSACIMAPVAVVKRVQRQGTGTRLIKHGLEMLRARGAEIVLVLGDPAYYARTGFNADHDLVAPYELEYPEAWMAKELVEGALSGVHGRVRCASCLSSPEYW